MKKRILFMSILFILIIGTYANANSRPEFWWGNPSSEIVPVEENSSIIVEKVNLVFDFTKDLQLKHRYYSISNLITAKYTMSNPTESSQTVQIALPLISSIKDFNPEDIVIESNGKKLDFEAFIGDWDIRNRRVEDNEKELNFSNIVEHISSSKYIPKHYNLDEIGTLHTYKITPTGDEEIIFAMGYDYDFQRSKLFEKGFNRYHIDEGYTRAVAMSGDKEEFEMFVIGEDMDFEFTAYTDVELTNETEDYSLDVKTKEISLREYLNRDIEIFKSNVDYLDYLTENQVFNLVTRTIDEQMERNVINLGMDESFYREDIDRFFVLIYEVDFRPQGINDVKISYNALGNMDIFKTSKPLYTFEYILNPARSWASFSNLNIEIIPPVEFPYIVDSSEKFIRQEDGTYIANFESLPEEDFFLTLYHKEKISFIDKAKGFIRFNPYILPLLGGLIGAVTRFIIRKIKRRVKKPKIS